MVPPAEFVPLAEEIGLIVQIGEWVLRQACHQAAKWPESMHVAVNLSPAQFQSRNLVPTVVSALASSGMDASRLELDITEAVLLQDNDDNLATLYQFKSLGVRISMDDFGTGYSSLGYLHKFPLRQDQDRSVLRARAFRATRSQGDHTGHYRPWRQPWDPPPPRAWRPSINSSICARKAARKSRAT